MSSTGCTLISGLALTTLILYIGSTWKDPGYITNNSIPFIKLLEAYEATSLCPDC